MVRRGVERRGEDVEDRRGEDGEERRGEERRKEEEGGEKE